MDLGHPHGGGWRTRNRHFVWIAFNDLGHMNEHENSKAEEPKSRGPKPKNADEVKVPLTLWISPRRKEQLSKAADEAGISRSLYCENLLRNSRPIFYGKEYKELNRQINKIGVNINQAAKALNILSKDANSIEFSKTEIMRLHEELSAIKKLLRESSPK